MTVTASIRPSGFSRILACAGSRRMQAKVTPRGSSPYAKEGSAAHALVADCLESGTLPLEHSGRIIEQEGSGFPVDEDMMRATQVMVGYCRALISRCDWYAIEKRLDIPGLDMDRGGTADFAAVLGSVLYVVDYKHGKGVFVGVDNNAQFLSYAHGALSGLAPNMQRSIITIKTVCVQPRYPGVPHVRDCTMLKTELGEWLYGTAIPAVKASRSDDAPLVPGDQCRWCDASGFCSALLQKTFENIREGAPDHA